MKKKTKADDTTPKITRAGKSPKARARAVAPESIFDELRRMEDRIMHGAYDVFERNGRTHGRDLQDWLDAEHELVWKPAVELREEDREFVVTIAVPGIDPKTLDIQVTAAHLLIKAEVRHEHDSDQSKVHACEFHPGTLFRSITFPKKIDPSKVRTEFTNGLVLLRAPIAGQTPTGPVKRRVS